MTNRRKKPLEKLDHDIQLSLDNLINEWKKLNQTIDKSPYPKLWHKAIRGNEEARLALEKIYPGLSLPKNNMENHDQD